MCGALSSLVTETVSPAWTGPLGAPNMKLVMWTVTEPVAVPEPVAAPVEAAVLADEESIGIDGIEESLGAAAEVAAAAEVVVVTGAGDPVVVDDFDDPQATQSAAMPATVGTRRRARREARLRGEARGEEGGRP